MMFKYPILLAACIVMFKYLTMDTTISASKQDRKSIGTNAPTYSGNKTHILDTFQSGTH